MNNNEPVLTVGDLRRLIRDLPADFEVWGFDADNCMWRPAVEATADKRSRSVNVWIRPQTP